MCAAAAMHTNMGVVEDRNFQIRDFRLQNDAVMPEVDIAYETYGRLAQDGRNAVLVTHGYTSSHHAAGDNPKNANQPGWWDRLIGPGKAIDTDRLYVVASNMLGSSYHSTNGAGRNPATGDPYGPDFPAITVRDIVAAQKALLDSLGVRHLVAVAGPSYGGYQAFQWAVAYPDMMDAVAAVVTAPRSQNAEESLAELEARLATDPEWHGGHYYGRDGAKSVLTQIRFETLMRYGYDEQLAARYPDKASREQAIRQLAADWAKSWDANSLVILRRDDTVALATMAGAAAAVLADHGNAATRTQAGLEGASDSANQAQASVNLKLEHMDIAKAADWKTSDCLKAAGWDSIPVFMTTGGVVHIDFK